MHDNPLITHEAVSFLEILASMDDAERGVPGKALVKALKTYEPDATMDTVQHYLLRLHEYTTITLLPDGAGAVPGIAITPQGLAYLDSVNRHNHL